MCKWGVYCVYRCRKHTLPLTKGAGRGAFTPLACFQKKIIFCNVISLAYIGVGKYSFALRVTGKRLFLLLFFNSSIPNIRSIYHEKNSIEKRGP